MRVTTLDSGVRVITDPTPDAASGALSLWVPSGSRDEPPDAAGAFHFLEHLLFKGTTRRSAHAVNQAVDAFGGELNAFTSKETTAFFTRVPAEHTDAAFQLLCEVVLDPALDPHDMASEREVILEELAMVSDTPDEVAASMLDEALFTDHPLGWEVLGRPETLDAMDLDALAAIHDRWYRHGELVVAAAGAVDHDHLVAAIAECTSSGDGSGRPQRDAPGALLGASVRLERDIEQVQVALGWRGLPLGDPDRFALAVLLHAFGDGPSSRLYREVRDERGLAYSIGTSAASYTDAGSVHLSYGATPRRLEEVREVVADQLDAIRRNGISAEELRGAIGYLQGSLVLSVEDAGARMSRLGSTMVARGCLDVPSETFAGYGAVTHEDVLRVAERVWSTPCAEVLVGPI